MNSINSYNIISSSNVSVMLVPKYHFNSTLTTKRNDTLLAVCSIEKPFPRIDNSVLRIPERRRFSSTFSSDNSGTSTIYTILQFPLPSQTTYLLSPHLWIGVAGGIGLSLAFFAVATQYKRRKTYEAFKAIMGESAPKNGKFPTVVFSPGSPMPCIAESSSPLTDFSSKTVFSQPLEDEHSTSTAEGLEK